MISTYAARQTAEKDELITELEETLRLARLDGDTIIRQRDSKELIIEAKDERIKELEAALEYQTMLASQKERDRYMSVVKSEQKDARIAELEKERDIQNNKVADLVLKQGEALISLGQKIDSLTSERDQAFDLLKKAKNFLFALMQFGPKSEICAEVSEYINVEYSALLSSRENKKP